MTNSYVYFGSLIKIETHEFKFMNQRSSFSPGSKKKITVYENIKKYLYYERFCVHYHDI